ncbi:MAG: ATP-binding cassette domain-containing protein [Methanomassiliicoccus sp.]|nr:ATP-binding cassette domain-containing protein [Methanomassiliicoccus sp.]
MPVEVRITRRLRDYVLNVDMSVGDDGIHVLVGRNGSGKTTILRMIAGLMTPDSGRIVVNGEVFFDSEAGIDLPVEERRTGFVFQNYAVFPHMTVLENLIFGLNVTRKERRGATETIRPMMEEYSLWDLRDVRAANLSGGQRQRVALLRTLILRPRIYLLDEPLSALDAATQNVVRKDIRNLIRGTGTPCMIVTHDVVDAVEMGDTACLLDRGKIVSSGRPREVVPTGGMEESNPFQSWNPASVMSTTGRTVLL